jgi:uncharacterized protein YciI
MKAATEAVEKLAAEVARLEEERDTAEAEAKRAAEGLEELTARKAALASGPLSDERGGAEELGSLVEAIDQEAAALSRTRKVAEDAAQQLDRLVLEAKVRHREAQKRLARRRYEALRYYLDGEAEEAMARLVEILERLENLYAEQVNAAGAADNPYIAYQDPSETTENWLARRLRRWLPNGSLESYDAPLAELDHLARQPEPEEEQKPEG